MLSAFVYIYIVHKNYKAEKYRGKNYECFARFFVMFTILKGEVDI